MKNEDDGDSESPENLESENLSKLRHASISTPKDSPLQLPASVDPPGPDNPAKEAVWVIFGATGHLGRSLIHVCLSHHDRVVAVGKTFESSPSDVAEDHANILRLVCDVRVRETVEDVLKEAINHWGRIDIIVNCSGYGVVGACEDQSSYEIRNQFETNFMGTLHIVQLSLPYFRAQQNGRYLIFSSTSGALGVPGLGPYCATKYATEALTESLLHEIAPFNIHATLVEPGLARRDDPTSAGPPLPAWGHFLISKPSPPYASPTAPAGHAQRMITYLGDRQPTSAVKCSELVWQLGHCSFPPLRLLLGSYAVESVRDRLRCVIEEIEDWKHLNFPVEGDGVDETMKDDGDATN